jgi:hypothetical protein
MKIIAFAFGCISVVLLAAGITLLSAIVLLGRPEQLSFAVTPSNIDRIGSFTPAPIPVTPQPAVGLPTVTPAIELVTAPSDTPSLATLPPLTLVAITSPTLSSAVPTPTAPPANVTLSQVESSGAEVEAGTELPERSPEVMGPLNRREGNSIFISAGFDSDSTVEVVVTDDTVIYRDNTEMVHPPGGPGGTSMPPSDDMAAAEKMEPPADMSPSGAPPTFQLEVELVDSLAEISGEVMILAWGEQQENQLVAQCLVYHLLSSH